MLILLSISFLLVTLEDSLSGRMGFSGLIAVVAAGVALQRKRGEVAARLSAKYAKLWVAAELLLFVLVGATVDLRYAAGAGTKAVLLIFLVLLFRMLGVWVCLLRTRLSPQRARILYVGLLSQGDHTGRNRLHPAGHGPCLR